MEQFAVWLVLWLQINDFSKFISVIILFDSYMIFYHLIQNYFKLKLPWLDQKKKASMIKITTETSKWYKFKYRYMHVIAMQQRIKVILRNLIFSGN